MYKFVSSRSDVRQYGKAGEPGIFSHMCDVRIERMVERV